MAPLLSVASATLLFLTAARAHFQVQYPPTIGAFDDDKEPTAPCGGYTLDFSKAATDFHVGGDAIATKSGHPQTQWLYRITTDDKAAGNWTQIYGQVQQSGVAVPESYIGQKAVLSIVADGDDGMLYQCSLVTFVAGVNDKTPSACTNSSSVTASFNQDPKLAALVGSSTNTTSGGGSSTGSTPSSSSPKNAAAGVYGSLSDVRALLAVGPLAALAMLVL
ncbi:expression library immunization antigen 1 [Apiospora aurea]|uniref:Expression library immunization antigen 1 n=1 Tax=Apiospora aurea TaxID=335848 RepID=A0ABR1QFT2_9PEZI